ncbi:hypothetical protein [Taibaiella koreensis]|uniref:hypothetical protein n=1 Tax=Taibaiella koreensis TaxID=1268548 RepID=UPI000E59B2CE|nr:hypothetical protein [Taibaiella koreensis]
MKKLTITIWLIAVAFMSNGQKIKVLKIDSTAKHYLITVSGKDTINGIIISKRIPDSKEKRLSKKKMKIVVGNEYTISLREKLIYKLLNKKAFEIETDMQGAILVDDKDVWKAGDKHKLYETDDLIGLFVKQ